MGGMRNENAAVVLILVFICLSCVHRLPDAPFQKVVYSDKFEGRNNTTILGEIKLEKGKKYAYKMVGIPEGQFNLGIYFKPKQGSPWFPDKEFPSNAIVRVSIYEEEKELYTITSPLSKWLDEPWGPHLSDRALIAPIPNSLWCDGIGLPLRLKIIKPTQLYLK